MSALLSRFPAEDLFVHLLVGGGHAVDREILLDAPAAFSSVYPVDAGEGRDGLRRLRLPAGEVNRHGG